MNKIYPAYSEPKFSNQLRFEVISWLGRHFIKKRSKIAKGESLLLLDIGVGNNFMEGWTHVDFYKIRIKFWKQNPKRLPEIQTDLRYPLDCHSNIVDGIYSGHTLEHFYPNHAYQLLSEVFRVLKPQGWLRINVPDLKYAIDIYNGNIDAHKYRFKAEAISDFAQNWGHHTAWDEELLTNVLGMMGFINIRRVEFGKEGVDKRLIKEKETRRVGTLVIEAQKP